MMNTKINSVQTHEPILINCKTLDSKILSTQNVITNLSSNNSKLIEKLRVLEIYKFADVLDICLLTFGTLASFASGACFPLLLFIYQQVTDALVNYGKLQYIEQMNFQNLSYLSCENGGFDIPGNTTSPIQAIQNVVKWYVLLGLLSIIFYTIGFSTFMISAERQIRRIRYRLFHNILYQDMSYFDTLTSKGKLNNMLTDDLLKVKEGIGDRVADLLSLLARMIGCLVFALVKGWKLTLIILAAAPLVIVAFNLTIKFTIKYAKQQIDAYGTAHTLAQEVITAIRTVTAFNGQKKEYERYATSLSDVPLIGMKKGLVQGLCQIFSNVSMGIVFTITLWYGQYLIKTECRTYSAGILVVIFIACLNTTWCLNQLVPSLEKFANASASGSVIFDTISRQSKIDASKTDQGEKPSSFNGEIKFQNVTFTYPARSGQPTIRNVNITIPSGKKVALVGHSGCGKSTILSLICRLYDPHSGTISLDGQDIQKLNIEWLRSHIGYVGQEPVLFSGSIEDNIRMGKPDATQDEVFKAAQIANAHKFIMEKEEGYETSAKGMLSGGEKQRIAIARAIVSNPKLLLLDEATSALDNQNEKIVQKAINDASEDRTTIIVAHRLSTIRDADLILVFDKGCIVEQGTHTELMQINSGIYHSLAVNQLDQEEEEEESSASEPLARNPSLATLKQTSSELEQTSADENEEEEEENTNKKSWRRHCRIPFFIKLLQLNSPEKLYLIIGSICALLFGSVEPAVALLYSMVYGLLANPNLDDQSIRTRNYSLSILGIYIFAGLLQFVSTMTFTKAGEALIMRMRLKTFETILRREMSWFDEEKNNVGSLVTRLSHDTTVFKTLTGLLIVIFSSSGALILTVIIGFMAGWKLTLVILCFTPLLILSGYLQGRTQSKAGQSKVAKSFAEEAGRYATEAIQHIRTVVTLNQERSFSEKYQDAFNNDFKRRLYRIPIQALGKAIANSFLYFIHVTAFSYGASLVESNQMTFDQVFRVFIVINFASMSIGRSTSAMPDYNQAKAAAQRIRTLCKLKSKIDPYDEKGLKPDIIGNIEFRNVDFAYPTRKQHHVLNKFNLSCLQEQTTALIGSSGCGKSTTVSLLLRFYDVTNGHIYLDGHDIQTLNINWLRSMIGYVQQEPILFNRTIRENIAYGINDREVTMDEIQEAAKQANIHADIIEFPEGYETNCGNVTNTQLAGGQKQRIAIARSLLRKPKILLLDEATSALDNKSERIVQEALDNVRTGRTCLTIAHRLSTIQNSEKIVVVGHGRVREQGQHEQLLQKRGFYYQLHRAANQQCT